jgi:DnaJ-class molecular chaperone
MKQPHKCPICQGVGVVPNGFYNQYSAQWSSSSATPETCRTCNGTGIIWCQEEGGEIGGNKNNEILNT